MMRRLFLALFLFVLVAGPAKADPIGTTGALGPTYSASSLPFEAFQWTPLDLAAFAAYGGDFANVRKPVERIRLIEDPFKPAGPSGPEDEVDAVKALFLQAPPQQFHFEELPVAGGRLAYDELPVSGLAAVPEPASAMLVGLGLLGMSTRLRSRRARR